MESAKTSLSSQLKKILGDDLIQVTTSLGETTAHVMASSLVRTLTILRDNESTQFQQLIDIGGVDYPERPQRFDVVYHLLSVHLNHRLRVKVRTDGLTKIPSVIRVYPCANWLERETWDLFGIEFSDHPDIRRLMTDYEFEGHPLRKDFPLTGYVEPRYDEGTKSVQYGPVNLPQDYRSFDYLSPWEGVAAHMRKLDEMNDPDGNGNSDANDNAKQRKGAA